MKMLRRVFLYLILIVFIGGAYYAISIIPTSSDILPEPNVDPPLRRIAVLELKPRPFDETIFIPGMVHARNDITLGAGIPGIIETVMAQEGDFVTSGRELFQIDLRSRKAMLEDAIAAHEFAQKNLERIGALRQQNNVSVAQYDEAVTAERRASATLRRMEVEVSLGTVRAPVSGLIDRVDVEVGEYVHEGASLARLLTLDVVEVKAGVPERFADAVTYQEVAEVFIEAVGETREGSIQRVAFGGDRSTNTFEIVIRMDNPDRRLRPGMIGRVRLVVKRVEDAILIPLFALVRRESGMTVYVERDGVVAERAIELGAIQQDHVEVLSGLKPDERIVVIGQQELVDGQRVNVMETRTQEETLLETSAYTDLGLDL